MLFKTPSVVFCNGNLSRLTHSLIHTLAVPLSPSLFAYLLFSLDGSSFKKPSLWALLEPCCPPSYTRIL